MNELLELIKNLNATIMPELADEIALTAAYLRDALVKQGFTVDQAVSLMSKMNVK